VPTVNEVGPIGVFEKGKDTSGNLPTLFPNEQSPKLKIKVDGDNVIIQSDKDMEVRWIRFHLLARWWVNDVPYVPKQTDQFWETMRQGILYYEKEITMPLNFEPALIGAKPGDKIGLQIMYCESEWDWCTSRLHGRSAEWNVDNLRLSNRIDFIAQDKKK